MLCWGKGNLASVREALKTLAPKEPFFPHNEKDQKGTERESDSKLFCILSPGHLVLYRLSYHKCYETHLLGNNGLTLSTHSATKMLRFQEVEPAITLVPSW